MNARHLFVKGLSDDICDYIVKESESLLNIAPATLGENSERDVHDSIRSSKTGFITSSDYEQRDLWNYTSNLLWGYINEANRQSFGFDVNYLSNIQYTIYEPPGDHYDWHIDTFIDTPNAYQRKLSMTVQLSDGSEYEGGDFEMRDGTRSGLNQSELKQKGTVLVFPSFISHRVKPVTKCIRRTLVAWFEGKAFK